MYFRKTIAAINYRLNQTQLRERLGVLCCLLLLPVLSWDLFVRQAQDNSLAQLKDNISKVEYTTKLISVEKNRIESQLTNANASKWLKEYKMLQESIALYNQKSRHYHQKTLKEKKLIVLLNAMFSDLQPLKMIDFVSLNVDESEGEKNQREKKSQKNNKVGELQRKYYQLHLQGNFFAILSYLDRIERFPWQIYWDEFNYQVDEHPLAKVEITFHAMTKDSLV